MSAKDIDAINGHLTATMKDSLEIENWSTALGRSGTDFPYINSLKGMIGHCLASAGSIECVASILQLEEGVVFGNVNCEDVHPEISAIISTDRIPTKTIPFRPKAIAKASFGFGDVNACVIFAAFND